MGTEIVGRSAEQAAIERFVTQFRGDHRAEGELAGPRGLAIAGEAGIGKSTLWAAVVAGATSAGALVLEARPASPEVRLSFSGLVDLLDDNIDGVLDRLPPPQRAALEVALHRRPAGDASESGIVGVAVLHALRLLAAARPVIVAIDDLQWLDAPSAGALEYAIRRLRTESIGVLTATRVGPDAPATSEAPAAAELVGLLPPDAGERLDLGPLPIGALHHLLRTRLDLSLPRPVLVRVHEQSGGNPLYALELARDWAARTGRDGAAARLSESDWAVPASLRDLLRRRLDGLPSATREVLLAVALGGRPTIDVVGGVTGRTRATLRDDLEPARRAGILELLPGDDVRIGHPLLAAAITDAATPAERRLVHRRLADLASEAEARARHLAAADDGPDLETAIALSAAADIAAARGATAAAVELLDDAVRRWPSDDESGLQQVLFKRAERTFLAGDTARAMAELRELVPRLADTAIRPDAEILLATVIAYDGDATEARLLLEAAIERTGDPASRGRMYSRLTWIYEDDLAASASAGRRAVELLDPDVDPAAYSFALMNVASVELQLGLPPDHAAIERGHEIQERARVWEYSTLPANWSKWMDDFDRSRGLTEHYIERARDMGDESSMAHLISYLVELECWTGRMDRAEALAEEGVDVAEQTGQRAYISAAHARRALVRAYRGRLEDARREALLAEQLAAAVTSPTLEALALGIQAFIAISADDPVTAAAVADRAMAIVDATGMIEAPMFRFQADQIEAHIELGHLELAASLLERLERRNAVAPRPSLAATGGRCRALLTAARGDVADALEAIDRALGAHARVDLPLEAGRSWLVAGQLRRRAGQRRAAAAAFAEAERLFEALGAAVWLDRTRRGLRSLGSARGSAAAIAADDLTPSETRIAELAASGLTNRAVAERLLISPKTVEASLARAYAKLGIRSRAELGARLGPR
jgi:DNA-binding CsgD family transcriptional regulator